MVHRALRSPGEEGQLRCTPPRGDRCLENQINLPTSAHTLSRPHTPEQAEAECPNLKKGGIKCTRARSECQATCGQCSSDECDTLVANLTAQLEVCTTSPSPPAPPPAVAATCWEYCSGQ